VSWDWAKAEVQLSKMRKSEERVPDVILNGILSRLGFSGKIMKKKRRINCTTKRQRERTAKTLTKIAVNECPDY
jgi:hypothetical protein